MTLEEVVTRLQVSEETVYRWIRQGAIPCVYRQGTYHFEESVIESWAHSKGIALSSSLRSDGSEGAHGDLHMAMQQGGVFHDIAGDHKDAVFDHIGQEVLAHLPYASELQQQLQDRESLSSTAVGRGIAMPHPRYLLPQVSQSQVMTVFLKKPCDFGAIDGLPVFVLFIVLGTDITSHLKLLSQLAQILRTDRVSQFLQTEPASDEIFQTFEALLE